MRGIWALLFWCAAALAEEDLLKVGKTPAEKLEQETARAKDRVEEALQKYEHKKQLLTQTLHGQEPSPAASIPASIPDPTQADPEFQRSFRAMLRGAPAGSGQQAAQPPLPNISLAAKVRRHHHDPTAMLRIEGQDFLFRASDSLTFLNQGQAVTIKVQNITEHTVSVLILPFNQVLTLR